MATEKEQQMQERLHRRAALVCTVLRKFISNFYRGRQEMIDEARAKELAQLARKGKKSGKKKAAAPKDDPKGGNKDKKPKKTPVQEAWQTFLSDMDERINKQKRVGLEDIYRGTALLEPNERVDLAALLATTNKKILPLASLNINQHNVRMALVSASAALSAQDAVPAKSCTGLRALANRGASAEQLLEQGFSVSDALRAGYPVDATVEAGKLNLKELREAGLSLQEVLDAPGTNLKEQLEQGPLGLRRLREAGYGASELVAYGGNFANPWCLRQAGFGLMELYTVGLSHSELRAAGFGDPGLQPTTGPASKSLQSMIAAEVPNTVATPWPGTQALQWRELLRRRAAQQQGAIGPPQQEGSRTSLGQPGTPSQSTAHAPATAKKEVRRTFSMMLGVPSKA